MVSKFLIKTLGIFFFTFVLWSCKQNNEFQNSKDQQANGEISSTAFDTIVDGKKIALITLRNKKGSVAQFTNFGARWVTFLVKDKNNATTDVIVGPGHIKDFVNSDEKYFGAIIGRYTNRIAKGKFSIDGVKYSIPTNNDGNMLHGGTKGFNDVVWSYNQITDSVVIFSYLSPDGEMGFPGNLSVMVTYVLKSDDSVIIDYEATTDKKTVVNLTNHAFFNLNGNGSGVINNHILQIRAANFTPVDATLIPTGKTDPVVNTPFDFQAPTAIQKRLNDEHIQLKNGGGYDHNFVLNRRTSENLETAAIVTGDKSGIVMEILTTEPGIQFYGGNFMQSKNKLKNGAKDDYRTAFCLETQHFPDSPNQPNFPSTELEPQKAYKSTTIYKFYTAKK